MSGSNSETNLRDQRIEEKTTTEVKSEEMKASARSQEKPQGYGLFESSMSSHSSRVLLVKTLKIENAMKKKKLELKTKRELLDLELAWKLAHIGDEGEDSASVLMQESRGPKEDELCDGNNPCGYKHDIMENKQSVTSKEDEMVPQENNNINPPPPPPRHSSMREASMHVKVNLEEKFKSMFQPPSRFPDPPPYRNVLKLYNIKPGVKPGFAV